MAQDANKHTRLLPTRPDQLKASYTPRAGKAKGKVSRLTRCDRLPRTESGRDDEQKAKIWSQKSEVGPAAPLLNQLRLAICLHWAGRRYEELTTAWEQGRIHIETLPRSPAKGRLKDTWLEWKNEMDKRRAAREALPKA